MAGLFGGARRALTNFARTDESGRTFGDKLGIIGATLRSVSDPSSGAIDNQLAALRQNDLRRQHEVAMDRFRSDIAPLDGPAGSGTGAPRTPQEIQQALMTAAASGIDTGPMFRAFQAARPEPQFFNTSRGVVQIMPDGTAKTVFDIPPEAPKASPGWTINPDGSWAPVPGGPYDPNYIRNTTETRRQAVVSNPMPRARRASGGRSGSSSGRPMAATPATSRRPWENYR